MLHIAASIGDETIVNAVLSRTPDVNVTNATGQTPLHYAASRNRLQAVSYYLVR